MSLSTDLSTIVSPFPTATNGTTTPGSNSTTATTGSTASSGSSASSTTGLASDFNTFLNLLTTQLQNQDPTDPVDSNQFTQQLVEFAGVQQQVQTNTLLQSLLTQAQGSQIGAASSYIGTTVEATGDQVGLTNGAGNFGYTLASAATTVNVTIKDSSGNTVFTGTGNTAAGQNLVQWDGKNSVTGATEPDGTYTVSVTATDATGKAITATPFEVGTVTSASVSNGTVMLNLGNNLQVAESNVFSVTNLAGESAVSASSGSSTSGSGS